MAVTQTRVAPSAVITQTALTGALANIQDSPLAPDALWLTTTGTNVTNVLVVGFPALGPGKFLSGQQSFRLWVRKGASGANGPNMNVFLFNNGVQVGAALLTVQVTNTTGVLYTVNWNASSIPVNGTTQLRITGSPASGGNAASKAGLEIGAADWLQGADSSQFTLWDGTIEQVIIMDGTWNGTAIVPTTVEGATV